MGGMGRERIHNMKHDFKFISKHSPQVKSAYCNQGTSRECRASALHRSN